jgi:four helix bundle protein
MSKSQDILIFQKAYQLTQVVLKTTNLFPKSQKFLMASRMEETSIQILEHIVQANEAKEKATLLNKASQLLERLRIIIRLSKDSCYIDFKKYENLSKAVDEIGRMLGGWIKYSSGREKNCEDLPQSLP